MGRRVSSPQELFLETLGLEGSSARNEQRHNRAQRSGNPHNHATHQITPPSREAKGSLLANEVWATPVWGTRPIPHLQHIS